MYATFDADNEKLSEEGTGDIPTNGPVLVTIGGDGSTNFGGGTVSLTRKSDKGVPEEIKSYTAATDEPDYIRSAKHGLDLEITGATSPDLYVEISPA